MNTSPPADEHCPECGAPQEQSGHTCGQRDEISTQASGYYTRSGFDEIVWLLTSWESPIVAFALMLLLFAGVFYTIANKEKIVHSCESALARYLHPEAPRASTK